MVREEFGAIEKYLRDKRIRYQNELPEQRKVSYKDDTSDSDSDSIIPVRSDDEIDGDESSTDEDYKEGDSSHDSSSTTSSEGSNSE